MVLANCCKLLDDGGKKNKLAAILLDKIIDILKKASEKLESFMDLRHTVPTSVICVASCEVFSFTFFSFFVRMTKPQKRKRKKGF